MALQEACIRNIPSVWTRVASALVKWSQNADVQMLLQRDLEILDARRARVRTSAEPGVYAIDGVARSEGAFEDIDASLNPGADFWVRCQGWFDAVPVLLAWYPLENAIAHRLTAITCGMVNDSPSMQTEVLLDRYVWRDVQSAWTCGMYADFIVFRPHQRVRH